MKAAISEVSTKAIVTNSRTTNNHLVYSLDPLGGADPDPEPDADVQLTANAYKVRGVQHVDPTWNDAGSTSVDVYRDGSWIVTVSDSSSCTDNLNTRGGGSYRYQVCEAGTSSCSNVVTATFRVASSRPEDG